MDLRKEYNEKYHTDCGKLPTSQEYWEGYAEWLESRMQWISVKDRLPEEGAMVTVCNGDIAWTIVYDSSDAGRLFTHWMPLPPPPETECEKN